MCRTYGARRVLALTQPFRAGLKFGPGPPGLQDVEFLTFGESSIRDDTNNLSSLRDFEWGSAHTQDYRPGLFVVVPTGLVLFSRKQQCFP
jgi:hypothetical protein